MAKLQILSGLCLSGLLAWSGTIAPRPDATPSATRVQQIRQLLRSGQVDQAEAVLRAELPARPDDAALLCAAGDIRFRRADFGAAAAAYRAALDRDASSALAYFGLGRIELMQFRRSRARDLIAKAFHLDPLNPDIVLAYVEFVTAP